MMLRERSIASLRLPIKRAYQRAVASPLVPSSRYRKLTSPVRVLPGFLILGAPKSGTNSLYQYLGLHPWVALASEKEPRFFDDHFARGLRWYRSHFPTLSYRNHVVRQHGGFLTGEATVYYLFNHYAPERVHQVLPDARLIAMLRDPVERAHSAFHHQVRNRSETLPNFAEAIAAEHQLLEGESERIVTDEHYDPKLPAIRWGYLARGRYLEQLQRWHEWFPREQLLVVSTEELQHDPAATFARVLEFLRLPPSGQIRFKVHNRGNYGVEIDPDVRRWLVDYFRPLNEALYEYLGRDLGWAR